MREIKFRGWVGGKMITPCAWINDENLPCHCMGSAPKAPLMQFTGLQDVNGVDIYEGDIVRWDDGSDGRCWRVAQVKWDECGTWGYEIIPSQCVGCFENDEKYTFKMGAFIYTPDPSLYGNVLEVIDNIHENPELVAS